MHRKSLYLLTFMLIISGNLFAQIPYGNYLDSLKKTVFHLNIINPGISIEREISSTNTFVVDASISLLVLYDSSQWKFYYYLYPQVKAEYRHYYNFSRRLREGKDINRFSGNYVGMMAQHLFGDKMKPSYEKMGFIWGTQYVSRRRFSIGCSLGFGYNVVQDKRVAPFFGVLWDLKIGFALN